MSLKKQVVWKLKYRNTDGENSGVVCCWLNIWRDKRVVFSVCSVLQELFTVTLSVIACDWLLDITN